MRSSAIVCHTMELPGGKREGGGGGGGGGEGGKELEGERKMERGWRDDS